MKIYLVRHGETTGDLEDRYGGDYDDHLTPHGKDQSLAAAKKLVGGGIEIIYTSPKIRAQETASIFKESLPVPVVTLNDLRERNRYGVLTGLIKAEAKIKYPEQVAKLSDEHSVLENGEDYTSFSKRIDDALESIDTGKYKTIALVTHGGPIRYIFRERLKAGDIKVGDCAFAVLEKQNNSYKLISLDGIETL